MPDAPHPAPLTGGRRPKFRRAGEQRRRQDLIEATLACVAERGLEGATVRAIARRAGVTAGLIRHYFPGKQDLVQAAYAAIMGRMTGHSKAALGDVEPDPRRRLAAFLAASLEPPVIDARVFSVWASFSGRATAEPSLSAAHRAYYLGFRDEVESLVAELFAAAGRPVAPSELRRHAIAVNAVIDGLWIEGCLTGDSFAPRELVDIGIASVERLLGLRLTTPSARKAELT
jgi:TetR/AcrR family transcriptional regulator, transcriptional repressor of bet genes